MSAIQTSPVLVPPPPRPPIGIATDAAEPDPERSLPRATTFAGFLRETSNELQRVVWPIAPTVGAHCVVTTMLMAGVACYLNGLGVLLQWALRSCGIAP